MQDFSSPWIKLDLSLWEPITHDKIPITLKKGQFLFMQGTKINSVYIIKDGNLVQTVMSDGGNEKILALMTTGAMCGELSLFNNHPQPYCIRAISDCTLYCIPADEFLNLLETDFTTNHLLLETLIRKIVFLGAQVTDLTFGSVYQRLAGELVNLSHIYGVTTPDGNLRLNKLLNQQELANCIGATRESVNRVLNQMISSGLLRKVQNCYEILDIQELKRIYASLRSTSFSAENQPSEEIERRQP